MRKLLCCISLFMFLFLFSQNAGAQVIIMQNGVTVGNIDDSPRDFYDPGGSETDPESGYYGQNIRDTMTLRTNVSGTVMYILFRSFVMGPGDTLYIFDGPDCNSPLVGYYNFVRSPGEIQGTNRSMTFVLHTDNEDIEGLRDGWWAQVYAYDTTPVIYNFGNGGVQSAITCYAEFYDSGGSGNNIQQNNENSSGTNYTEFISPVGTHIKCEFTQFSVNGVLKIYDGQYYDPNRRLIGQFCTSTLDASTGNKPPILFSTGNTLTFVYVGSTGDVSKAGWRALITCVPELFESEDGNPCPNITNSPLEAYEDVFDPDTKTIVWDCENPFVVLQASVISTGQYTNDYKVESIPFDSHIFEFTQGTSINASSDDNWLSAVPLPFTFSFFGKQYNTVWPGTNGLIAMDNHSGSCAYKYGVPPTSPPYTTQISDNQTMGGGSMTVPYNYKNCIYGVYEDIDCNYYNSYCYNTQGAVKVGVLGSYPCRAFVFNYLNVGLFGNHSSPSNYNTYQMVIYEGTNIIDVYVRHRACCASTNPRGEGIIGLQNNTSSQILLAPGRGMSSWTSDNEAWRFTPVTPLDEQGELTWYVNDINSAPYSHDKLIAIGKPDTSVTKYISVYTFTNASGQHFTLMDTTTVLLKVPTVPLSSNSGNSNICPGDAATLSVSFEGYDNVHPESYLWSTGDTTATCVVNPTQSTTYSLTVSFDNGCDNSDTARVFVTDLEMPKITGDDTICFGKSTTLTATHPTSNQFRWSTGQNTSAITVSPQVTTDYVVSATMTGDCIVTDTLTVTVLPLPVPSFMASPTEIYVENGIGTVTCTNLSDGDYHLVWNFGDVFSNVNIMEDISNPSHDYTRAGYYTITLTAEDTMGCVDSTKSRVTVEVPYFFYIPNAFTPDGDGVNETFAPQGQGVDPDQYSMQIFDRQGMLVYSTRNPYEYWDGRNKYGQMCPEGVYVYLIRLVNLNKEDKEYSGTVTLVK